jgi:hypothetical protein
MSSSLKDDGYQIVNKHCYCIEFRSGTQRRGFHSSHLIEYTLEENPDAKEDTKTPPEKLVLAFSTADVTISGWRLGRLADALRDNELAAVSADAKRGGELDPSKSRIASIVITMIEKE